MRNGAPDVPQLEAIISKSWSKEDELRQLKSDLAALDRKIIGDHSYMRHISI